MIFGVKFRNNKWLKKNWNVCYVFFSLGLYVLVGGIVWILVVYNYKGGVWKWEGDMGSLWELKGSNECGDRKI